MRESLVEAFAALSASADSSELDAALLINVALEPGLDVAAVRDGIARLAPDADVPVWEHLSALGFRGDDHSYHDLANSRMDAVLARRRGIPITLSVLLVHLARQRGEPAVGLNAPGHFLSRIGAQVIDPFTMQVMPVGGDIEPAGPVDVALRMLNNIKQILTATGEQARALDMVDYQLALLRDTAAPQKVALLLLEKGEYWRALGAPDLAVGCYGEAADLSGEGTEIATVCRARMAQLGGARGPTLH